MGSSFQEALQIIEVLLVFYNTSAFKSSAVFWRYVSMSLTRSQVLSSVFLNDIMIIIIIIISVITTNNNY